MLNKCGKEIRGEFNAENLLSYGYPYPHYMWRNPSPIAETKQKKKLSYREEYIERLKDEAEYYGYSGAIVDMLLSDGYSTDDIEELIYCS